MPRPVRALRPESFEMEGRLLPTAGPGTVWGIKHANMPLQEKRLLLSAAMPDSAPLVAFGTRTPTHYGDSGLDSSVLVTQQSGEAVVTLTRSNTVGTLRVKVTTDPTDPHVGVNVAAVDQTVTFEDGRSHASLTVPILAGAPNPGVVDIQLIAQAVDPATIAFGLLDLKILASDPNAPPKVLLAGGTRDIQVSFNKPMNPASASNVRNYVVYLQENSSKAVPLRSAVYDPATQTATLIPKQRNLNLVGDLTFIKLNGLHTSIRPGSSSSDAQGLIDLQGNLINPDATPGKVAIRLLSPLY